MSSKRPRTPTRSSSSDDSSHSPSHHASKSTRTHLSPGSGGHKAGLQCTLPPTCNPPRNHPTLIASTKDLEAHYARYHAHVCESPACGCVFPDARLLDLHQTECHDPLAALRKEKGEKIFACLLASCPRIFSSPKTRRLHLIDAHQYPKEYFFAVVNKGVGGLLKRWGDGVSLLRGEWKGRDPDGDGDDEDEDMEVDANGRLPPPHMAPKKKIPAAKAQPEPIEVDMDHELDALTSKMTSLDLSIPPTIRFGRGGKSGGFKGKGDGGVGAGVGLGPGTNHSGNSATRAKGTGLSVQPPPLPRAEADAVTYMVPAQVMRNAKARGVKSPPTSPTLARMPAQATVQPPAMSARGRGSGSSPSTDPPRAGAPSVRGRGAVKATGGRGLQPAMDHILENEGKPVPDLSAVTTGSSSINSAPQAMDVDEDDEDAEALRAIAGKGPGGAAAAASEADLVPRIKPLTEEEKAEKLKELREKMAAKRAKKAEEELKEQKVNENLRRKSGKEMNQFKEDLKLKQALKDAEQKKKEKIDDAKAKAAIKAQIEADKKARAEKFAREKAIRDGQPIPGEGVPSSSSAAPAAAAAKPAAGVAGKDFKETRLQIRMASGGPPYTTTLPSDSTLRHVAEFLAGQTLSVDVESVSFTQTFPRKQFTHADLSKTLRDLGLTPSAVSLIPSL
ncbi:hypothetical protein HWV62_413 [Athelia sp. TMB]|nr:hypothetical protein HWV62_413 [Athelia sp. TMB]